MDYRRVEKTYRRCACSLQIALIGSLAVFVSLQFSVIFSSAHSVPVKISMEEWENAGVWAICDGDVPPFGLHGAGLELQNDTRFAATLDIKYRHWRPTLEHIYFDGKTRNCSLVNLSEQRITAFPFAFMFCAAPAHYAYILLQTDGGQRERERERMDTCIWFSTWAMEMAEFPKKKARLVLWLWAEYVRNQYVQRHDRGSRPRIKSTFVPKFQLV